MVKKRRQDRSPDQPPINPSNSTREIRPEAAQTVNPVQTTRIFGVWTGFSADPVDAGFPL